MSAIWNPGRKSALTRLMAAEPELPPASRGVGADGQQIIHPDPIFPAWSQIEREIVTPELDRLWSGERTARQVVTALVPRINALLQALPRA